MLRRLSARLLRRLDRIAEIVEGWRAARERESRTRQVRQRFAELLRRGLRDAGIDPAAVPALRRFDRPEPATDPPLPVRSPPPTAAATFLARVAEIARRCRADPPVARLRLADPTIRDVLRRRGGAGRMSTALSSTPTKAAAYGAIPTTPTKVGAHQANARGVEPWVPAYAGMKVRRRAARCRQDTMIPATPTKVGAHPANAQSVEPRVPACAGMEVGRASGLMSPRRRK